MHRCAEFDNDHTALYTKTTISPQLDIIFYVATGVETPRQLVLPFKKNNQTDTVLTARPDILRYA